MNSDFKISRWLYYKYKVELQWLEYLWNHENMFETELKNVNHGKKNGGLPPLLVRVPLLIVNNYSEFQVNIFSNNRDIRKCQSFRTPMTPTMPGLGQYLNIFFENSRAKNWET